MKRAILHVGAPRTGTSSFQKLLSDRRTALAEAGVLYPELTPRSADRPHLSHQHLGEALDGRRPRAERRELLDGLDAALAATAADVAVISYERLWLAAPWRRLPRVLADLCARRGFRPEVLVTVRPQAELIQSQYGWRIQFLREGRSFAQAFGSDLHDGRLDLCAGLTPWARAVDGRASAVPLRDVRSDAPLPLRIAAELGLSDRLGAVFDSADAGLRENRSPGPVTTEVSRRLRRAGLRLDAEAGRRAVDEVAQLAVAWPEEARPFRALTAAQAARAARRFARSNTRFADDVWGKPWEARVAAPAPGEPTEIAGRETSPELEAAMTDIAAQVRGLSPA